MNRPPDPGAPHGDGELADLLSREPGAELDAWLDRLASAVAARIRKAAGHLLLTRSEFHRAFVHSQRRAESAVLALARFDGLHPVRDARALADAAGPASSVARWTRDSLAALLPGLSARDVRARLDRALPAARCRVGVADIPPGDTFSAAFARAETALARAPGPDLPA